MSRVIQLVHATAANVLSQPPNTSPFSVPFLPSSLLLNPNQKWRQRMLLATNNSPPKRWESQYQ
ncbi:hypothetical protein F3Y22_tig00113279pilonHSYRG00076 [Hibiscus syriacus]|uniref:Uncharacterized protein n=1 Tax=Hibiscus syriacus TaxID=106335 RepID=A0A6A2X650_HIBSY|nr:hypothetical protein F3Y22_tig00113279pilonHSYRG00076 [Hibiscus syriacus]